MKMSAIHSFSSPNDFFQHITFSITIFLFITLIGCDKTETDGSPNDGFPIDELPNVESHLSFKSGYPIYSDDEGNKYLTVVFDKDHLEHLYSLTFEEGKKYHLAISNNYCEFIDFLILTGSADTLFYGIQGDIGMTRKYIYWETDVSETYYLSIRYTGDINFNVYEYHVTFEEIVSYSIQWNDLTLICSGDWFITSENYLALACHHTSFYKWAKIEDNSLFNYTIEASIGLKSGIPDIYTGIAIYGSDEMSKMFHMPYYCIDCKIIGPSAWEQWGWHGVVGRSNGLTTEILNRGEGAWNHIKIKTHQDSIQYWVNSELVIEERNTISMHNGVYFTVEDMKNDTVYFKDTVLVPE
jgi:hypothetical protein